MRNTAAAALWRAAHSVRSTYSGAASVFMAFPKEAEAIVAKKPGLANLVKGATGQTVDPEELGGAGADFLSYVLVLEELSRADAGVGVTVAVHTSATTLPILSFGTEEQKSRFVPPLARGEQLGAFALTESGSGSDAGSLRTTAPSSICPCTRRSCSAARGRL